MNEFNERRERETKRAIKGGEFLVKETKAHEIFIPEEWNEEQKKNLEAAGFPQYTGGGER